MHWNVPQRGTRTECLTHHHGTTTIGVARAQFSWLTFGNASTALMPMLLVVLYFYKQSKLLPSGRETQFKNVLLIHCKNIFSLLGPRQALCVWHRWLKPCRALNASQESWKCMHLCILTRDEQTYRQVQRSLFLLVRSLSGTSQEVSHLKPNNRGLLWWDPLFCFFIDLRFTSFIFLNLRPVLGLPINLISLFPQNFLRNYKWWSQMN